MPDKSERVLIEYPDGQRYGCPSADIAKAKHPGARILRYLDGRPYVEPEPAKQQGKQSPNAPRELTPGSASGRKRKADDAAAESG